MDATSDTAPYAPATRREHTYRSLKARLVAGECPAGERLREERLATELGVSRTPVREALVRLQADGFVERRPDGYVPVVPDLHTIRELYDVRFALERWAITNPARGGAAHDPDALESLRADWLVMESSGADGEFVLLDEDFHVRLAAASGNESLVAHLQSVNERIRVVRVHDFLTSERLETTITQHLAVLDALHAADIAEAEVRLVRNFEESLVVVEQRAALAIAHMVQRWRA